jgi:hypothetical protein
MKIENESDLNKLVLSLKPEVLLHPKNRIRKIILGWDIVLESPRAGKWRLVAKSHMEGDINEEDRLALGTITLFLETPINPSGGDPNNLKGPYVYEWND